MSQQYSESNDFKEHSEHIAQMDEILKGFSLTDNAIVLDVGGGQGMHACFLAQKYAKCYCLDIIDYQSLYNGEYYRLFKEKCERNSVLYTDSKLRFIEGDAMDILFRDEYFDFVTSFNAFEHIPEPAKALDEMIRVTRKGGLIYITFDPIWTADTGSHFIHRVPEPWQHLISSESEFIDKMIATGAMDTEVNDFKLGMNRKRLNIYREIFEQMVGGAKVKVLHDASWSGTLKPEFEKHPNYKKCIALGYSRQELLLRGMRYLLQKK